MHILKIVTRINTNVVMHVVSQFSVIGEVLLGTLWDCISQEVKGDVLQMATRLAMLMGSLTVVAKIWV